jgi:hypothetical protein
LASELAESIITAFSFTNAALVSPYTPDPPAAYWDAAPDFAEHALKQKIIRKDRIKPHVHFLIKPLLMLSDFQVLRAILRIAQRLWHFNKGKGNVRKTYVFSTLSNTPRASEGEM